MQRWMRFLVFLADFLINSAIFNPGKPNLLLSEVLAIHTSTVTDSHICTSTYKAIVSLTCHEDRLPPWM